MEEIRVPSAFPSPADVRGRRIVITGPRVASDVFSPPGWPRPAPVSRSSAAIAMRSSRSPLTCQTARWCAGT